MEDRGTDGPSNFQITRREEEDVFDILTFGNRGGGKKE